MTISLKCPVCNAVNSVSDDNQTCRRCKSDLSVPFGIKYHSYYNRLIAVNHLLNNNTEEATLSVIKAIKQAKSN